MLHSLINHSFLFLHTAENRVHILIGKEENKEVPVLRMLPTMERKYCLKELGYKSSLEKFPVKGVTTFLQGKPEFCGDPLVPRFSSHRYTHWPKLINITSFPEHSDHSRNE